MSKKNHDAPKIDAVEWIALVTAAAKIFPVVRDGVTAATADGRVTPDEVRGVALDVLGLPHDLPPGPLGDFVDTLIDALAD
jgi:hypothetical protein